MPIYMFAGAIHARSRVTARRVIDSHYARAFAQCILLERSLYADAGGVGWWWDVG